MLNKVLLISLLCVACFEACESLLIETLLQIIKIIFEAATGIVEAFNDESEKSDFRGWDKCGADLRDKSWLAKTFDKNFLIKQTMNLNLFSKGSREMRFYLFKREFPECGRELLFADAVDKTELIATGFDATLPTRIIIHGWMSPLRGSFNKDVKDAYLKRGDFNVIVTDWSATASNLNYFSLVGMVDGFGMQLARFTEQLNEHLNVSFDDIYLIGHSLGAQIAGAAGKHIKPSQYNTIFALDPAGPNFRKRSIDFRIDPTDAKYVESIQTSARLGFLEPTGRATFYPNFGVVQGDCFYIGCSHVRAYKMFAESIVSDSGFWGHRCLHEGRRWDCNVNDTVLYRMGGEPSVPKSGVFYVKTKSREPFAMGKEAVEVIKGG